MRYSAYSNIVFATTWDIAGFIQTLTDAGIWTKLDVVNLAFTGDSAYINLKDDSVIASLKGAAYYEANVGFYGDLSTAYIEYNYIPSMAGNKYSTNSAYVGVYQWEALSENGVIVGCNDGTNHLDLAVNRITNNTLRFRMNSNSTTRTIAFTGKSNGYFAMRKLNNDVYIDRDGVQIGTNTVTTAACPTKKIYGCANNINDTAGSRSINKLGVLICGEYLTEAEDLILFNALNLLISSVPSSARTYNTGDVIYKELGFSEKKVVSVYDDYIFAVSLDKIHMSDDAGATWTSQVLVGAFSIDFAYIWDTGSVNFALKEKMYRSDDLIATFAEITPVLPGGGAYTIHVPTDPAFPGSYYIELYSNEKMYRGGTEFHVWGNYGNREEGANPTNIYELTNDGVNLTVIYQFGQNEYIKDDGTTDGGTTGNLLGDATNPVKTRHVHSCAWDEISSTIYFATGDFERAAPFYECMIGKLVYNSGTGLWTPIILIEGNGDSDPVRVNGLNYKDGYLYFGDDSNVAGIGGVWRVDVTKLTNFANFQMLYDSNLKYMGELFSFEDILMAIEYNVNTRIIYSQNLGNTWSIIELDKIGGYPNIVSLMKKGYLDSDGYRTLIPFYATTYNPVIKIKPSI